MYKYFSKNTQGRDFVVGDLHGCYDDFMFCMKQVEFNYDTDRVFCVGDLIDRGPNSLDCTYLIDMPWFYCIQGNHERMMIEEQPIWIPNGGMWALSCDKEEIRERQQKLNQLPFAMELQTGWGQLGIIHAEPGNDWQRIREGNLNINEAVWSRNRYMKYEGGFESKYDVANIDLVVVGHTIVDKITRINNILYIDTGSFLNYPPYCENGYQGKITMLNVEDLFDIYLSL